MSAIANIAVQSGFAASADADAAASVREPIAQASERRAREREADEPPADADVSPETLQKVIGANARLSIEAHEKSGDYVYKSIDRNTGEVINQWPPEKFLRFLEAELERLELTGASVGVVADQKA